MMITGDHAVTARAIARQLGTRADRRRRPSPGVELDALTTTQLPERVARDRRVRPRQPEHKLRLVQALQALRRMWSR